MAKSGPNKSRGDQVGLVGANWFRNKKAKTRRKELLAKASRRKNRGEGSIIILCIMTGALLTGLGFAGAEMIHKENEERLLRQFNQANYRNMVEAQKHGVKGWWYPDGSHQVLEVMKSAKALGLEACETDTDCQERFGGDGGPGVDR